MTNWGGLIRIKAVISESEFSDCVIMNHSENSKNLMSPTLFRQANYRFFFLSREKERMHVHIYHLKGEVQFWLEPEMELANNYRLSRQQLKEIEIIIVEHYHKFTTRWQQYFGC